MLSWCYTNNLLTSFLVDNTLVKSNEKNILSSICYMYVFSYMTAEIFENMDMSVCIAITTPSTVN